MAGLAVARLGVTVQDFYRMSPHEFAVALNERGKYEEAKERGEYERLRTQLLHQWNMAGKTLKTKIKDPKTIFKLPWDNVGVVGKKQTADQMRAKMQEIAEKFKKS